MGSVSLIDGHIDNDTPRMTDEQIIQAYACCNISDFGGCDNCPCQIEDECIIRTKGFDLEREVFNVFNHQKAEIERLEDLVAEKQNLADQWRDNVEELLIEIQSKRNGG